MRAPNQTLIDLCHRRWAIPAIAMLHDDHGSKFVTLHRRLGASTGSMRGTLDHLIELGYVRRPSGRGHPLRPEYELTAQGHRLGEPCVDLMQAIQKSDATEVCAKKWSLPVIDSMRLMEHAAARFGDVRASLDAITDRALTQSLRSLQESSLLARRVEDGYPPVPIYTLARRSNHIANSLEALSN